MAQIEVGALYSKTELTLHTYHATRAWFGRAFEPQKPHITGMRQYLMIAGKIQQAAARDDPYADIWMLRIDEKLADTRKTLSDQGNRIKNILDQIPEELSIEKNLSQQPFRTGIYPGSHQGWEGVHLLIQLDRIVRDILLARHISLLNATECFERTNMACNAIRSLCSTPNRYPGSSGATREDFAANNARARAAIEKYGELPEDILQGTRRSSYAPPIRHERSATVISDDLGIESDNDRLMDHLEEQAASPEPEDHDLLK